MEERFIPQMIINYHAAQRDISVEEIGVGSFVIVTWGKNTNESLAATTSAKLSVHWLYPQRNPLYTATIHNQRVSFNRLLSTLLVRS